MVFANIQKFFVTKNYLLGKAAQRIQLVTYFGSFFELGALWRRLSSPFPVRTHTLPLTFDYRNKFAQIGPIGFQAGPAFLAPGLGPSDNITWPVFGQESGESRTGTPDAKT